MDDKFMVRQQGQQGQQGQQKGNHIDDNERLNEVLSRGSDRESTHNAAPPSKGNTIEPSPPGEMRMDLDLCQWQVGPNGMFRPAAKTVGHLMPGCYSTEADNNGMYLRQMSTISDEIVKLPESANIRVLEGIRKFWGSRARYQKHGLIFKRGVLLWGPPGSGKTVTVHLLTRDLIDNGGIVIFCGHPDLTAELLKAVRRIEPDRPLIVVYEDIDEIVSRHGEHTILSLLDGEQQTDNLVSIATTNYPDRLGARIVNRPSRFDDRIFVGMPSLAARRAYLNKATGGGEFVERWAEETDGLSIAHLRELVAAVICLDQEYGEVLSRLRSMNERPREVDGYRPKTVGFGELAGSRR